MTRVFTKSECDNKGNKCDDTIGPKRKNVLAAQAARTQVHFVEVPCKTLT